MRNIAFMLAFALVVQAGWSQTKNFIDQPYLETSARVDTLVTPDRIFLQIRLQESDTKGRTSLEELEKRMATRLSSLGIDLEKQLTVSDPSSDFQKYFL
ncbi:MAG: SIMPL domain-containing protein, partial [Robiginitalea sp.]|nr:SIMPL domain-containing protein [Robiginitalea sp.]